MLVLPAPGGAGEMGAKSPLFVAMTMQGTTPAEKGAGPPLDPNPPNA